MGVETADTADISEALAGMFREVAEEFRAIAQTLRDCADLNEKLAGITEHAMENQHLVQLGQLCAQLSSLQLVINGRDDRITGILNGIGTLSERAKMWLKAAAVEREVADTVLRLAALPVEQRASAIETTRRIHRRHCREADCPFDMSLDKILDQLQAVAAIESLAAEASGAVR